MFVMMTGIKTHSKKSFLSHQINSEIHSSAFIIITMTNNPSLCTQHYECMTICEVPITKCKSSAMIYVVRMVLYVIEQMVFNRRMINWLQKRVGQKILLDHHIVLNHKSFAWSVIFPSLQLRYCNLIEYINYLWGAGISTYHFILVNWYNHIFYSNIQIITV